LILKRLPDCTAVRKARAMLESGAMPDAELLRRGGLRATDVIL